MGSIKMKILKCSNDSYWYKDLVGHTIPYIKSLDKKSDITYIDDYGNKFLVDKSDVMYIKL